MTPRARRGMTLLEALVATVVFLLVLLLAWDLWRGAFRGFFKGEDALTSAQEAALVVEHLRRDLLAGALAPPGAWGDVGYVHATGSGRHEKTVRVDRATRQVSSVAGSSFAPQPGSPSERIELRFFRGLSAGQEPVEVVYVFDVQRGSLLRRVGAEPPRSLCTGRLRRFEVKLMAEPDSAGAAIELNGPGTVAAAPVRRLWWHLRVELRSEPAASPIITTEVPIETNVFPKNLNRSLVALWKERGL
jgi:type II secretory pathway pseudopilin PulG